MKKINKVVVVGLLALSLCGGVSLLEKTNQVHAAELKQDENGFKKIKVTPTEMVETYAKDMNISFDEALKNFPVGFLYEDRAPGVSYQLYERVLNTTDFFYRPKLRVYVKEVDNRFSTVYNSTINTQGKVFQGRIFLNVESGTSIYYQVDGHFYETGSMSVSGGISLGVGGFGSLNFSGNTTRGAFAYVNFDGHVRK